MRGPLSGPHLADQSEPSDEQLLARIADADPQALECLYDRYAATVYALALHMLQRGADAETVVVETFWRIWDAQRSREPIRTDPAKWIYTVAYQASLAVKRRRSPLAAWRSRWCTS